MKEVHGEKRARLRSALMRALGRADLVPEREAILRRIVGRSAGVDRVLQDGDRVDLGSDVRLSVVHTPGHTAGSVCFFWESGGMVFSGDAVQGHGWRAGLAPIYHDAVYVESLNRIESLGASTLCMGHTFYAPFIELAQAAFRELVFDLPVVFDRRTIVPPAAAGAIRAHLRDHGWQSPRSDDG